MSRPSGGLDEKRVKQNGGDPGGHHREPVNTHSAAAAAAAAGPEHGPDSKLLSALKRESQARRVDLTGRGGFIYSLWVSPNIRPV